MENHDHDSNININQPSGVEVLADMPSFDEHMAENTSNDNLSDSRVEENKYGPREIFKESGAENADSQEFLQEQLEQIEKYRKMDERIFDGIRSIDNKGDRDLATATLACYYPTRYEDLNKARPSRILAGLKGMETVVECIHEGKTRQLRRELIGARHEWLQDDSISEKSGGAKEIMKLFDSRRIFYRLQNGNKIDNYKNNGDVEFRIPGQERSIKFEFSNEEVSHDETAIVATMVNGILERLENMEQNHQMRGREYDAVDSMYIAELEMLERAYSAGISASYRPHSVEDEIDFNHRLTINKTGDNISRLMMNAKAGQQITMDVDGEGGAAEFVAANEIRAWFHEYKTNLREYRETLRSGQRILDRHSHQENENSIFGLPKD